MKTVSTARFERSYYSAPATIRQSFEKQLIFLLEDIRYPSLHAKKYNSLVWQARVTRSWRFYFRIEGDTYILLDIMAHPK
jgi:mRNA interferase RelE/StbE